MAFPFDKNNVSIALAEIDDAQSLALLHERCFHHGWDSESFEQFLSDPTVFCFIVRFVGKPKEIRGFILARLTVGEAEVISLAVDPNFRKRGFGHMLMDALLRHLHHERAEHVFLEVDENNKPALTLYRSLNFIETGRRPAYYQHGTGRSDALIMKRTFKLDTP